MIVVTHDASAVPCAGRSTGVTPYDCQGVAQRSEMPADTRLLGADQAQSPFPATFTTEIRMTKPGGGSGIGGKRVPGPM